MQVTVTDFRPCNGKTLQGFLTIQFPEIGFQISDVAYHENGKRGQWLQLPAKPFTRTDGSKGWNYILEFCEKAKYRDFEESTLDALNTYQRETGRGHYERKNN